MSSISKFGNALVSMPNEFTVTAANFNLDFSLMKVEAPPEFHGLRDVLSSQRRSEAEEGQPHITARKLGALFQSIVPPIPNLEKAYGKRVSAISRSATAQQKPPSVGIFSQHAGLDGTSIWAAATSGQSALAMHLLACMLARMWKSHEAISIWVELVEQRKLDIKKGYETTNSAEIASIMAAQQIFDRHQLAAWDASARAWLQTADSDRKMQQTQLTLIINNVSFPVNTQKDTYASVLEAWNLGLCTVERLVQGMPQKVQNGAVLLALSAWHLYPNMQVLSEQVIDIDQHDELMKEAIVTVSTHTVENAEEGVFWSLPLAHMRYYSPPVDASRRLASDTSRVSVEDFWIIVLGSIISQWEKEIKNITVDWLNYLANAARTYRSAKGVYRQQYAKLFRLGLRHCESFLNPPYPRPAPFFGLSHCRTLFNMITSPERTISILRKTSETFPFESQDFIIRYPGPTDLRTDRIDKTANFSYASLIRPNTSVKISRNDDGSFSTKRQRHQVEGNHFRWVIYDPLQENPAEYFELKRVRHEHSAVSHQPFPGDLRYICASPDCVICVCSGSRQCNGTCHQKWDKALEHTHVTSFHEGFCSPCQIHHQKCIFRMLKEDCIFIKRSDVCRVDPTNFLIQSPEGKELQYEFFSGSIDDVAIFKRMGAPTDGNFAKFFSGPYAKIDGIYEALKAVDVNILRFYLGNWFMTCDSEGSQSEQGVSMNALVFATEIYKSLGDATISIETIQKPLYETSWAKWISLQALDDALIPPERGRRRRGPELAQFQVDENPLEAYLAASFACIAALESGECDIDIQRLKGVMALSIGDSIFVLSSLISDPCCIEARQRVQRVFGNLGRPEMAFLIPTSKPRLKDYDLKSWHLVNHLPFDGKFEKKFDGTSLHLSFTDFEMPVDVGSRGLRDNLVVLLESLVSLNDRGKHLGDIDISSIFRHEDLQIVLECPHAEPEEANYRSEPPPLADNLISIDSWDEFFDYPETTGIIRAHGNWQARLAFAATSSSKGRKTLVLPEKPCLRCLWDARFHGFKAIIA